MTSNKYTTGTDPFHIRRRALGDNLRHFRRRAAGGNVPTPLGRVRKMHRRRLQSCGRQVTEDVFEDALCGNSLQISSLMERLLYLIDMVGAMRARAIHSWHVEVRR